VPCEEVRCGAGPDYAAGRERFADLRLALAALPAEQRDVIMLRFLVGLTPREVAVRLGRSEDAVHGLQHRGRRRLRRELQRIRDAPEALPLAA
jgi:RNA polymerase sigma-70 factor (ECF subfamily)